MSGGVKVKNELFRQDFLTRGIFTPAAAVIALRWVGINLIHHKMLDIVIALPRGEKW